MEIEESAVPSENIQIVFSESVQAAIDQVMPSTDPLDSADFNPTDYINQLFPSEQSLSNIDDVIGRMESDISIIDDRIRTIVRDQTNTGHEGRKALEEAQKIIGQLFTQVTDIKTRAERTEDIVKEITRDIKQLDCAKKNLTSAITTLNHLHMLVGGVESLTQLVEKHQYGELLNPLQAITEVNRHFQQYTEISQIKELSNKVSQIHDELAAQITQDFHRAFQPMATGQQNQSVKLSLAQLTEACRVISVLKPSVKSELLTWFVNLQLQEYTQLFHENQDIAWLDKIDQRYAWLKRHLLDFESKLGHIFPENWEMSERITIAFCRHTHDELVRIMARRRAEIDVKLLLYAIGKTSSFEVLLSKRFSGVILTIKDQELKENTQHVSSADDEQQMQHTTFINVIGKCFLPYLDIYTDNVDRNLAELMEHFVQTSRTAAGNTTTNAIQSTTAASNANNNSSAAAAVDPQSNVFPSCADLFVFYKKCLVQCTQLSNGKPMYDLSLIFRKYLREYAQKMLETRIPKVTNVQTSIGTSMSMLTRDLQHLSTAAGQVIHNLLKEGETPRFTRDEQVRLCCILSTAEYCLETVQQLEDKLKEKVDKIYEERIDLTEEKDIFHRIISNSIQLLVQDMESGCEPALIAMNKMQWQNVTTVGDQSSYISSIISHFRQMVPVIRDNLSGSRKYYTQFCHKFVNAFIPRFINHMYKCRPCTAIVAQDGTNTYGNSQNLLGCEQLLLDVHSLKTALLDLPSIRSMVNRKAPASYTKAVIKGMTKAEMIVKLVMAPISPAMTFCEQYMKLLPDNGMSELQKVLDMKGLKRADQQYLIELYKRHCPRDITSGNNETSGNRSSTYGEPHGLNESEFMDQKTLVTMTDSPEHDKGRIKKLEKLIKSRLPN